LALIASLPGINGCLSLVYVIGRECKEIVEAG
jgi:hypothetical protein